MIPENFPLFNSHVVPKHFDDAEARLRSQLHQDAVPTLDGGRHLLSVCSVCTRPFYTAGRRAYPRLTEEQLAHLGTTFHADVHALHLLPRSLCPICSAIYLDGLFTIEVYRQDSSRKCQGYHLLWESASPPYTTLVAMVYRPATMPLRTLLSLEPDTGLAVMQDMTEMRALLAWLETRLCPPAAGIFSDEERHLLARRLSPAHGMPRQDEEPRIWWGYSWRDACQPLDGTVLVSLAVTVAPLAPAPLAPLLPAWRTLARVMRIVW